MKHVFYSFLLFSAVFYSCSNEVVTKTCSVNTIKDYNDGSTILVKLEPASCIYKHKTDREYKFEGSANITFDSTGTSTLLLRSGKYVTDGSSCIIKTDTEGLKIRLLSGTAKFEANGQVKELNTSSVLTLK